MGLGREGGGAEGALGRGRNVLEGLRDAGTTITAQIVAFKVTKLALLMIAVGFGMLFFSKQEKIKQIALLLKGALLAEKMVGLKMNVSEAKLKEIVAMLPSLNAPTVSPLYQSDWFAVETVVASYVVRDLIPQLMKSGAEGIIEFPLNKVI